MPDTAAGPLQEFMPPSFTGPVDAGVSVGVKVGVGVAVGASVTAGVDVEIKL